MTGLEIAASASRAIIFVATMLVVGSVVFDRWIAPAASSNNDLLASAASKYERLIISSSRLATGAAFAALLGEIARLCIQVTVLASGDPWMPMAHAVLFGTSWGKGWSVGLAGALLFMLRMSFKRERLCAALSIAGAVCLSISPALTGHAIASEHYALIAIIADVCHVVAASIWLGTLGMIFLVALTRQARTEPETAAPRLIRPMIIAFSPIALWGAGLLLLSGSIGAFIQLDMLSQLWTTTYGELLLTKIGLFLVITLTGAYNWKRVTPRLSDASGIGVLKRSATFELLIGAITVCVTAVFVGTSPM